MDQDWRFKESPHVAEGGLRAYAGVPLRFETEFGQHVAFGSLCVASNFPQAELSAEQQRALARLADWIVSDMVTSARARRQRERRRMTELTTHMQRLCDDGAGMEEIILKTVREVYPNAIVELHRTTSGRIQLEGGADFATSELDQGLWEDVEHFDHLIVEFNHLDMVASKIVRAVAVQCASQEKPTFLVVGSKDFRYVFDDVDSTFIQTCATILCRFWQRRALREALNAKDAFLRGITHQLRTPIHGILGSVELLTEELKARNVIPSIAATDTGSSPSMEQSDPHLYLRTIRTSARELISTVNSLIKLNQWAGIAQAERKTSLYTLEHIEQELLKEVSRLLPLEICDRPSIIFQHDSPSNCDSVTMDLSLFLDCVQPLIINAVQNTPGGVVAVTLHIADDLRSLTVDVEDNGQGIDPKDHERIFVAHEKLDIHTIGAGLGLTLSCKSAAFMNGTVSLVRSTPGAGSLFRVDFQEPVCLPSLTARPLLSDRLQNLPRTFHHCQWASHTSLLGRHVNRYLENCGYIQSAEEAGSLILIDFTPDLSQVYTSIGRIPASQVGICLVPECVYSPIDFKDNKLQRQNNVVFVQGPFLPRTLEEALIQADSILAEFAASAPTPANCMDSGVEKEMSRVGSTKEPIPEAQQREIASLPAIIEIELEQSLKIMQIATRPTSPPLRLSSRSSKPMALLVDDNRVNLRLLEMYCYRRNIPYCTAQDGDEAVHLFNDHRMPIKDPLLCQPLVTQPFDLILMDLQMPKCDGVEATRQIRALEREHQWQRSVIFIVTGQDSPADRRDAAEAGANDYLVKPIGPKEMDRWVKQEFPNAGL
jgi:signal transduction histidine kinase/ActR/RegA family two-component response regulator